MVERTSGTERADERVPDAAATVSPVGDGIASLAGLGGVRRGPPAKEQQRQRAGHDGVGRATGHRLHPPPGEERGGRLSEQPDRRGDRHQPGQGADGGSRGGPAEREQNGEPDRGRCTDTGGQIVQAQHGDVSGLLCRLRSRIRGRSDREQFRDRRCVQITPDEDRHQLLHREPRGRRRPGHRVLPTGHALEQHIRT